MACASGTVWGAEMHLHSLRWWSLFPRRLSSHLRSGTLTTVTALKYNARSQTQSLLHEMTVSDEKSPV